MTCFGHNPYARDHSPRFRWTVAIIALPLAVCAGCIPVRLVQTDQPVLVAPVGIEQPQADGSVALNPSLPQPKAEDFKPPMGGMQWADMLLNLACLVLGGTGVGAAALPVIGKLKTGLRITAALADANAAANTDVEVRLAKQAAQQAQDAAGVRKIVQRARGKA